MYLGAENVCVGRESRFEFHGPSWLGLTPLPQAEHERSITQIAQFYPEPLDEWFISHYGQTGIKGMVHFRALTGAELIEMGAAVECSTTDGETD